MTPRRVLLTADAVGGVWRYVLELAAGIAANGGQPLITTLGPPPSAKQRAEAEAVAPVIVTDLPLDWTAATEHALERATGTLADIAERQAVDLAHLHAPALAGWGRWPVPIVSVVHSCLATWWRAVRGGDLPDDFRWRTNATERGLTRSDAVIAPSAALASAVRTVYGLERPILTVHNGRRAPVLDRRPRERAVLAAGRLWDEGKDIATLDRAAARMRAPVYAAGPLSGPNGASVRFHSLTPLGELDEGALWHRYAGTAILASTSRYEPFGLGVLEAAQAGMALVLADIPTFRELWGGVASFFAPGDDAALRRLLDHLLDDPRLADQQGALARERARNYGVDAMVERTLAIHETVLAGRARTVG